MQHVNQALEKVASTTGESVGDRGQPSQEAQDKATAFFYRLALAYGESRTNTLWRDDTEKFQLMRREWVDHVAELTWDQLDSVFQRLKARLRSGDRDYFWPDIARVLRLADESDSPKACHRVVARKLPEPEWRKREKRTLGRLAAQTSIAVLDGRACFLEDKWHASC